MLKPGYQSVIEQGKTMNNVFECTKFVFLNVENSIKREENIK